jgi:hypothetical protein
VETAEPRSTLDSPDIERRRGLDLLVFLSMGLLVGALAYVCTQCHASRLDERLLNPTGRSAEQEGPVLTWPEQYPSTENLQ